MEISGDSPGLAQVRRPSGGFINELDRISVYCACGPSNSGIAIGAPMEALIALVAASFVRHGIESPGDLQLARPNSLQTVRPAESTLTTALPEHNYRKGAQEICP